MNQSTKLMKTLHYTSLLTIVILGLLAIVGTGGGGGGSSFPQYYYDGDGDGYGDMDNFMKNSSQPEGYVADNTDCDDFNAEVNPGSLEACDDGIDNDCDGAIDEDCGNGLTIYYLDADGDGYGNPENSFQDTSLPNGYVVNNTDCDDANEAINPGADEICEDGIDNDCNGQVDEGCTAFDAFTNSLGMTFNLIPAGTFIMGSPEGEIGRYVDENQHQVTLTQSFYMQTTEVTQGQWQEVMGSNPSDFPSCGENCPVERVSWNDVQDFITAINALGEGTYRLPTEAEWEYACRAGSTSAFANGPVTEKDCGYDANLDIMGWYCNNSEVTYEGCYDSSSLGGASCAGTHPVAQKQANALGLYDMHGNVWEWCSDWHGDYPAGSIVDPTGPESGSERIHRGGSWYYYARYCRSAHRVHHPPSVRRNNIGFRLVCLQTGL